jgi:phage terminase small subunit
MGRAKTVELLRDTKPERLLPVCPEWLSEGAKAAWGELVPLVDSDTLLIADTPALALLCCTYAEWRRLSREVEAEGFLLRVQDRGRRFDATAESEDSLLVRCEPAPDLVPE